MKLRIVSPPGVATRLLLLLVFGVSACSVCETVPVEPDPGHRAATPRLVVTPDRITFGAWSRPVRDWTVEGNDPAEQFEIRSLLDPLRPIAAAPLELEFDGEAPFRLVGQVIQTASSAGLRNLAVVIPGAASVQRVPVALHGVCEPDSPAAAARDDDCVMPAFALRPDGIQVRLFSGWGCNIARKALPPSRSQASSQDSRLEWGGRPVITGDAYPTVPGKELDVAPLRTTLAKLRDFQRPCRGARVTAELSARWGIVARVVAEVAAAYPADRC